MRAPKRDNSVLHAYYVSATLHIYIINSHNDPLSRALPSPITEEETEVWEVWYLAQGTEVGRIGIYI